MLEEVAPVFGRTFSVDFSLGFVGLSFPSLDKSNSGTSLTASSTAFTPPVNSRTSLTAASAPLTPPVNSGSSD